MSALNPIAFELEEELAFPGFRRRADDGFCRFPARAGGWMKKEKCKRAA